MTTFDNFLRKGDGPLEKDTEDDCFDGGVWNLGADWLFR
jgi:hypothetical protein